MGGDYREQGDQGGGCTVTWGEDEPPSESRTGGCHHHEDDRTVDVAWPPMAAEDGSQIRGIVLTELARLLAEAPGAVSLDAVATRGSDLLLTLRVPRARLAKVFGERGTPDDP